MDGTAEKSKHSLHGECYSTDAIGLELPEDHQMERACLRTRPALNKEERKQ